MAADEARLNWVQVVAGAGAAVSAAVLLSTLGVAGTITGAAVGSIVASIGSHAYSRGIDASREQASALRRIRQARGDLDRMLEHPDDDPEAGLEHADVALGRVEAGLTERRRISWKHVAVVAAALFAGVMIAITGFELLTGRAVSSYTGGSDKDTRTTVPGVEPGKKKSPTPSPSTPAETPTQTVPTPTVTQPPTPTLTPTVTPTEPAPTAPTGTPTEPTPTAPAAP